MSVRASAWAWDQQVNGNRKLVLLALADSARDDGLCWPGQKVLSVKCGLTDRAVRMQLQALEEAGLLVREPRYRDDGSRRSDLYRLGVTPPEKFSAPPERNDPTPRKSVPGTEPLTETSELLPSPKGVSVNGHGNDVFDEWIRDHAAVTGYREPRQGTKVRAALASSFAARVVEGYTLEELKLASRGARADDFRRERQYDRAESVLRPTKVHDLIEKGRRAAAAEQDASELNRFVCN